MREFRISLIVLITMVITFTLNAISFAAFEKTHVGARSMALGGATIASTEDSTAIYHNPALLADLSYLNVVSMYGELYGPGSLDNNWISGSYPFGDFTVAAGVSNLNQSSIDYKETTFLLGSGLRVGNINLGFATKSHSLSTPVGTAKGLGIDAGALFRYNNLSISIVAKDLYSKIEYTSGLNQPNDLQLTAGIAYRGNGFIVETNLEQENQMAFGIEKAISSQMKIRGGLYNKQVSFGVGLELNFLNIDYAYQTHEMGGSNLLTLGFSW